MEWNWPNARLDNMLAVQAALCGQFSPNLEEDEVVWVPSNASKFVVGATWNYIAV